MNPKRTKFYRSADRPLTAILLALAIGTFSIGVTGCEQEGPVEETAEEVDESVEEAGEEMGDAAEEAGDEIEEAADELEDETS